MIRRTLVATIIISGVFFVLGLAGAPSKSSAEPVASGEASGQAPPMKEIDDAVARFKERDFDGALKLLKEAVTKNADLPPAQIIMAQLFAQANIPQGMRNYLEQAVMESPADPEAYVLMGDIAVRERRITEGEMLFLKANDLMAKFDKSVKRRDVLLPRIFSGLATVAEARDDWPGVQKQLDAWLKVEPKSSAALQRYGRCLFQQKNPAGALEKLKEAAKNDPEVLTPEAYLAQFYEQTGDRENAKKWMDAALVAAPKDFNTRLVVAQWDLETGQLGEAETQANVLVQIDSKKLEGKILRGAVALFKKDYPTAERYFEAAKLQSPKNFAASNNLALVLIEQKDEGKRKRALEYAEINMKQYGKSKEGVEAASTYGWVLYRMGKLDEAEKALQAAVSAGGLNSDTAYYLARLSADKGREDQAKQLLEVALKGTGPFLMKKEAQVLLDQLKK